MKELIEAVRAHALKHYSEGGWDYVVEAWDDEDLAEFIGKARTPQGAIKAVGKFVKARHEYAEDIRSS